MTVKKIETQITRVGSMPPDKLIRELLTFIDKINANNEDLQTQIIALKNRIDLFGIP